MKLVKNFVYAALLVCALTVKISAGEQDTPTFTQQPPPPTADKLLAYEEGTSPSGDPYTGETAETTDYLFFEALAALLSVY